MTEPWFHKFPHEYGTEHCWIHEGRVLGKVTPLAPQKHADDPVRWAATVGQQRVGIFTGKRGRCLAQRAVMHFSKHLWAVRSATSYHGGACG